MQILALSQILFQKVKNIISITFISLIVIKLNFINIGYFNIYFVETFPPR